jgi:hypothetical protein
MQYLGIIGNAEFRGIVRCGLILQQRVHDDVWTLTLQMLSTLSLVDNLSL